MSIKAVLLWLGVSLNNYSIAADIHAVPTPKWRYQPNVVRLHIMIICNIPIL